MTDLERSAALADANRAQTGRRRATGQGEAPTRPDGRATRKSPPAVAIAGRAMGRFVFRAGNAAGAVRLEKSCVT
jgi:hypothetical protein